MSAPRMVSEREAGKRAPRKLTDAMRDVLTAMVAHPGAAMVHDFRIGWMLRYTKAKATPNAWAEYEVVARPLELTMSAMIARGLVEVKVPRTTPGLHIVTAYLTDAGRAALLAVSDDVVSGRETV